MTEERVLPRKTKKVKDISPSGPAQLIGPHRDGYESEGSQRVGKADSGTQERCPKCNAKITDLRIRSGDCCRWVVMR